MLEILSLVLSMYVHLVHVILVALGCMYNKLQCAAFSLESQMCAMCLISCYPVKYSVPFERRRQQARRPQIG